jgi:hypothetical protein
VSFLDLEYGFCFHRFFRLFLDFLLQGNFISEFEQLERETISGPPVTIVDVSKGGFQRRFYSCSALFSIRKCSQK